MEIIKRYYYRLSMFLFHFIFGLKSGFPLCCILFYSTGNTYFTARDDMETNPLFTKDDIEFYEEHSYVLCPKCVKVRNSVKVIEGRSFLADLIFDKVFPDFWDKYDYYNYYLEGL